MAQHPPDRQRGGSGSDPGRGVGAGTRALPPPDWLVVDSLPALAVLQGAADLLPEVQVVCTRVVLSTSGPGLEECTCEAVHGHLDGKRRICLRSSCGTRHPLSAMRCSCGTACRDFANLRRGYLSWRQRWRLPTPPQGRPSRRESSRPSAVRAQLEGARLEAHTHWRAHGQRRELNWRPRSRKREGSWRPRRPSLEALATQKAEQAAALELARQRLSALEARVPELEAALEAAHSAARQAEQEGVERLSAVRAQLEGARLEAHTQLESARQRRELNWRPRSRKREGSWRPRRPSRRHWPPRKQSRLQPWNWRGSACRHSRRGYLSWRQRWSLPISAARQAEQEGVERLSAVRAQLEGARLEAHTQLESARAEARAQLEATQSEARRELEATQAESQALATQKAEQAAALELARQRLSALEARVPELEAALEAAHSAARQAEQEGVERLSAVRAQLEGARLEAHTQLESARAEARAQLEATQSGSAKGAGGHAGRARRHWPPRKQSRLQPWNWRGSACRHSRRGYLSWRQRWRLPTPPQGRPSRTVPSAWQHWRQSTRSRTYRQRSPQEQLVKAEAQIELIKDLLLRETEL
jgi:hypothetical protein